MARRFVWLAVTALAIGAAVVLYRGPGRAFVRGHVGDVAATMLVYALVGLAWRARPAVRPAATFATACAIEFGQTAWHATSWVGEMTVGSTFDAWDFAAYAAGVLIALAWERAALAHAQREAPLRANIVRPGPPGSSSRAPGGHGETQSPTSSSAR